MTWEPIETAKEFDIVAVAVFRRPVGYWESFGLAQLVEGRWLHCRGDVIPNPTHWLRVPGVPDYFDEWLAAMGLTHPEKAEEA